jgi:hypothetical protein
MAKVITAVASPAAGTSSGKSTLSLSAVLLQGAQGIKLSVTFAQNYVVWKMYIFICLQNELLSTIS